MAKISTRGPAVRDAIRNHEDFVTHGALSGHTYGQAIGSTGARSLMGPWDSGRLSGADLEQYRADMRDITYAVFSYATPIGWATPRGWYRVGQKFSVTTSKHQGQLPLSTV